MKNIGTILHNFCLKDGSLESQHMISLTSLMLLYHSAKGKLAIQLLKLALELIFRMNSSRNCIGKNFALQEMRIVLATLLKHFDIASIEEEMKEATKLRQRFVLSLKTPSFNIKIKRRI
jgi:hypothetical protein